MIPWRGLLALASWVVWPGVYFCGDAPWNGRGTGVADLSLVALASIGAMNLRRRRMADRGLCFDGLLERYLAVMYRTTLICAIGIVLSSAAVSGQTILSEQAKAHLRNDRFDIVTSMRGLPIGVREGLQSLFASHSMDIFTDFAEPGARFQESDVVSTPKLPIRRLVLAECSIDHCLVYYERGGRAHTWHVALFHWTPAETRFEFGGAAPAGLKTMADVWKAVLSGAIKESKVW